MGGLDAPAAAAAAVGPPGVEVVVVARLVGERGRD